MLPLYLVDGFNLLHAVMLTDRTKVAWWALAEQRHVVELSEGFEQGEVCVVFDERGSDRVASTERVQVMFAPDADEYIVSHCAALQGRRPVVVVSADRSLCDRSLYRGAARLSPWKFAMRCRREAGAET